MAKSEEAKRLEERQNWVAKVVWGLFLIIMGVVFTYQDPHTVHESLAPFPATYAVDGRSETRWSSQFRDPQWLMVDLGEPADIGKVRLNWEEAFAEHYDIQLSDDANAWTTLVAERDSDGSVDEHTVSGRGRYIRMNGLRRSTDWGYSLWELEVYGPDGTLLSREKPATASSIEKTERWIFTWIMYWPAFLIVAGLPALIAPKDSGNQVLGIVLTGIGSVLLLNQMKLVSWGFKEALPIVLILAGALLVIQSLRGPRGDEPKADGPEGGVENAQ